MKNSEVGDEVKVSTTSGDTLVENTKVAQYQLSTLSGDNSLFLNVNHHLLSLHLTYVIVDLLGQ